MAAMKAMVLTAPGEVTSREVERPSSRDSQALVQVTHSGICGTDLKIFKGDIPVTHPLIMGHEMIGELVEGGNGLAPGSRVIVDPSVYCGHCFHCRAGQTNLCPNGLLLGRDRDGGFADFLAAPPGNVFPLPAEIGDREAPMLQVLTTCLHAQRLAEIFPGEAVVVLGLGVTGQLHAQLAKARGADPVIGITRSPWKRELAQELGADLVLAPDETTETRVLEATDGRGADLVIETVGHLPVLSQAIELARIGGRLLTFGIYTARKADLPFYQLYFKELKVINGRAAKGEDFPASIDLVRRQAVRLEPLVSHTSPVMELAQALGLLAASGAQSMKIILEHA
jgi:2-desacetyl-2-hydroxyethyl bacteriochlorophyllide A dehydrogenase